MKWLLTLTLIKDWMVEELITVETLKVNRVCRFT